MLYHIVQITFLTSIVTRGTCISMHWISSIWLYLGKMMISVVNKRECVSPQV